MIKQQWCACGAGVGDANPATATQNINEFIDFHPRICKAGLVDDKPLKNALRCPHCDYQALGESQEAALEMRTQHINSNHQEVT